MPKKVDHEQRRAELTAALIRIVAERGLDEVSVREVAAVAGVSVGTVQYYFSTKDEMLLVAAEHVFAAGLRRAARVPPGGPPADVLHRTLREFLPLDDERMTECRIWVAFAARAAVSPAIRRAQLEVLGEARTALRHMLAEALVAAESIDGLDPAVESVLLLAVLDGLTLHGVQDPVGHPAASQEAALRHQIDRLFLAT